MLRFGGRLYFGGHYLIPPTTTLTSSASSSASGVRLRIGAAIAVVAAAAAVVAGLRALYSWREVIVCEKRKPQVGSTREREVR